MKFVYRKKMGFVFPLADFMQRGRFRQVIEDTLSETSLRKKGLLNPKVVQDLKKDFFESNDISTQNYRTHLRVWMATLLELWLRRYAVS